MNVYEELANKLEDRIKSGALLSGQKLPSVRELSLKETLSPSTVVEAYELLKERGLIEARKRSGFFVAFIQTSQLEIKKKPATIISPATLNPDDLIRAIRAASHDPKIFPFGAASPMPDYFPNKALARTINKVLSDEPAIISEYRFAPGSIALRDQISQRYLRLGVKLPVDTITTTAGAIEAIGLALRVIARPGELIALETPCYFGILQLVRMMGYKILEIPIRPDVGLVPQEFEEALKKGQGKVKALVSVSNFSNPMGSLVPEAAKARIVNIAAKNNVVIIEDDIYGELYFEGHRPLPFKAFDKTETVITCGSYAKTISPAFRVGYVCSKKYAEDLALHKAAMTSGVSGFAEESLALFLDTDGAEKHLRFLRSTYKTLVAQYSSAILSQFPEGTKISQPRGGFILWVQLPKGVDSRDVQRKALQQSISISPGPVFSGTNRDYINFMRMNCAIPFNFHSQKAIAKLAKIVDSLVK